MKKILIVTLLVVLSVVCFAVSSKLTSQSSNKDRDLVRAKIEKSPDISMRIERSEVSPLGIQEAKVKSISRFDFAELTGSSIADSANLVSLPKVVLVNTSDKVITTFAVGIKNFKTDKIRGVSFGDKLIKPGDTFVVEPQQFVFPERITITDANGKSRPAYKKHSIDSPQMWIPANNEELAIRVSVVHYENGEKWLATNTNW